MKEEEYYRIIGKLSRAVVLLSLIVVALLLLVAILFAFEESEPENTDTSVSIEPCFVPPHINVVSNNLFKRDCASCHFIDKDMTGPAIKGASQRGLYKDWFFDYMTNQDSLIEAKEPYTMHLQEKWSYNSWTHDKLNLTQEQVKELELLTY